MERITQRQISFQQVGRLPMPILKQIQHVEFRLQRGKVPSDQVLRFKEHHVFGMKYGVHAHPGLGLPPGSIEPLLAVQIVAVEERNVSAARLAGAVITCRARVAIVDLQQSNVRLVLHKIVAGRRIRSIQNDQNLATQTTSDRVADRLPDASQRAMRQPAFMVGGDHDRYVQGFSVCAHVLPSQMLSFGRSTSVAQASVVHQRQPARRPDGSACEEQR